GPRSRPPTPRRCRRSSRARSPSRPASTRRPRRSTPSSPRRRPGRGDPDAMRAAVVGGRGQLRVEALPAPVPGGYEALVEILACGVCSGTDSHLLGGEFPWAPEFPFVLGHEAIGRVVRVGPRVRYLKEGDLVLRPLGVRPGDMVEGVGSGWGGFAE